MLSILLGNNIIKVAQFSLQGKRVRLRKLCQMDFDQDVFGPDNTDAVVQQIKEFFKANRLSPQKTVFCISHHDIVSMELVLPLLSPKEAESVIVNEIEKAPRFANNPYVYTYQMHQYPFDQNTKVIYYVFQKSFLQTAEKILRLIGCLPVAMDIAPLSILNTFVGAQKEQALVYLDRKVSNLMVYRDQECRASYLFNVGIEDFSEGFRSKEAMIQGFSRDLRTLLQKFYNNEKSTPLSVVFTGEYPLSENFFDQVSLATEHECSPFVFDERALALPKDVSMEEVVRHYALVVGAIFRLVRKGHYFNISNVWDFEKTADYLRGFWFKVIMVMIVCGLVGAGLIWPRVQSVQDLRNLRTTLTQEQQALRSAMRDLENSKKILEVVRDGLLQQIKVLNQVRSESWRDVFRSFNQNIPDDIWLNSVAQGRAGKIIVNGSALNLDAVALMIQHFKDDPRFSQVLLTSTNERKMKDELFYQFTFEFQFLQSSSQGKK